MNGGSKKVLAEVELEECKSERLKEIVHAVGRGPD